MDSLKNVRKTLKGSDGRRGLGTNGQEWWCLKCLESLFVDLRERVWKHKPDGSTLLVHPLTSIQYWIIPERRTIPQLERKFYTLQSPQIHLLAKWQAVKTYDELRDRPAEGQFNLPEDPADGPLTLYLGQDGESFYLDRAARDIRGVLTDGRVCEIDATNVRGYSLSEALRRLDKLEDQMVEAKWKPIMAERKRKAEQGLEERSMTEGQLAEYTKQLGNQVEVVGPEKSEVTLPVVRIRRHTLPIAYVGNVLPEMKRARKSGEFDQKEESVRSSRLVLQAPTVAPVARTVEEGTQNHSPYSPLERSPSDWPPAPRHLRGSKPTSLGSQEVYTRQGAPISLVSTAKARATHLAKAEDHSSYRVPSLESSSKNAKKDSRVDAKGGNNPRELASQTSLAPCGTSATQRSPPLKPLKFAPKPASRVYNKENTRATMGAEDREKQKDQPDD